MITVSSFNHAKKHKRKYDAVLTIEDTSPVNKYKLRFTNEPKPDHLILSFEDLDFTYQGVITPTIDDVVKIINFGRKHVSDNMLIHCFAGRSRSTAAALGILYDRLGSVKIALDTLLKLRPIAVPNLLLVKHFDTFFGVTDFYSTIMEYENNNDSWKTNRTNKVKIFEKYKHLFY